MSLFFTYQTGLPEGAGYELFHAGHFLILGISLAVMISGLILYGRQDDEARKLKYRRIIAALLPVLIVVRLIYVYLCGAVLLYDLPLHFCSIAGILCFIYEYTGVKMPVFLRSLTEQTLLSLCLPGAVLALLFSDGTMYPVFHFITIQSTLFHVLIILYVSVLLYEGRITPSLRQAYKAVIFLLVLVPAVMVFDRHFKTNYMFLLYPSSGSPLSFSYTRFGYQGYLIFYALTAFVWIYLFNLICLFILRSLKHKS